MTARRTIIRWLPLILAIAVAVVLQLWSVVARAQDATPAAAGFLPPGADEFVARSGLGVLFVGLVVRVLRGLFPFQFAPEPATLTSKRLVILASVLTGLAFGAMGFAPAVAEGLQGTLLGGFGVGALAYVAVKALPDKLRGEGRGAAFSKKARAEIATMNTGEFRALKAEAQADEPHGAGALELLLGLALVAATAVAFLA